MAKKVNSTPRHQSEDQGREFWSRADSTEYIDWSEAQPLIGFEFKRTENANIMSLLVKGEKEISSDEGHSLENVMEEADDLLKNDEP